MKPGPKFRNLASDTPSAPVALLVIAYGNELRKDDGLGPRLGRAIAERADPGVHVIVQQQLTPDLAEPISQANAVLFLDAAVSPDTDPRVQKIIPAAQARASTHFGTPAGLLALASVLYRQTPPAWWLSLPATDLGFGQNLSENGQRALAKGLKQFDRFRAEETGPDQRAEIRKP